MTAPTPCTIREWQLDADSDITVSVQIADECNDNPSNVIVIRDERGGTVCVYRSAIDEFIAAVRDAADEVSS